MKKIMILFLFACAGAVAQSCPVQGDSKNAKIQAADRLKNRQYFTKASAKPLDLETLMQDSAKDTCAVYVDAYITSAKISGPESCECHVKNKSFLDYHIYISYVGNDKLGKHNQIVEVSRFSRALNPDLTFDYVKTLVGHKVRIYGYVFNDEEHKSAIGSWRAGIQEIHPVFFIDKLN